MLEFLKNLDISILQFINTSSFFSWLDPITPVLTDLHLTPIFKVILISLTFLFFFKKFKRTGITYFIFLVLSLSINDFIGGVVKRYVERPRPFQVLELNVAQKSPAKENRSFYSNHSANMFNAATYLTVFFPLGCWYFFSFATFIAFTRIHVGVHYPSDVIAGSIMGILIAFIISKIIKKIVSKTQKAYQNA